MAAAWMWPGWSPAASLGDLAPPGVGSLTGLLCLRVKRTFYQHVPSPVAFFQPLYSVHNGNFKVCALAAAGGAGRAGSAQISACSGCGLWGRAWGPFWVL